jgi:hypothetical protein
VGEARLAGARGFRVVWRRIAIVKKWMKPQVTELSLDAEQDVLATCRTTSANTAKHASSQCQFVGCLV